MIKDGEGTVLQRFNYYPFGSESRVWTAGTSTPQSALRYRFGGKEIAGQKVSVSTGIAAAAAGSPYLDFGARVYDPRTAAWLSQDPLSEKYYSISPYAYCAGNPVNLVDPTGMQWYSYSDENGKTYYVYSEGSMSDDVKGQYNNLNLEGYSFIADNKYYSLFGRVLDWTDIEGKVYEKIDRLIIKYATDREDMETGIPKRVSMYISDMPRGENRTFGDGRPFIYGGNTFTTLPVGSFFPNQSWYSSLFGNGENKYLGNVYWNTKDLNRPDIDTSLSYIISMPDKQSYNPSLTTKNLYYWLRASNPLNGVNAGFQTLQLLFSPLDAKAFMRSYNNIFGQ